MCAENPEGRETFRVCMSRCENTAENCLSSALPARNGDSCSTLRQQKWAEEVQGFGNVGAVTHVCLFSYLVVA